MIQLHSKRIFSILMCFFVLIALAILLSVHEGNFKTIQEDVTFYSKRYENLEPPILSNKYSVGPGEGGEKFNVNVSLMTPREKEEYEKTSEEVTLNVFVSDRISVRRYLKDLRFDQCKEMKFRDLPETSVIITFHNEVYSLLLRTIHSVLDRSDPSLIREIILVDDASDSDYLRGKLQNYLKFLDKVKLIRLTERNGLTRARIAGIKEATAETLTFLDSHCEVLPGWLEPLLEQVKLDQTTLAEPDLINISGETFDLEVLNETLIGVFGWLLDFGWGWPSQEVAKRDGAPYSPMSSPVTVGGVFSINSKFFEKLGYWDDQLELYGYENTELSFNIWMCHGRILKVPCSQVGHVFHNRKKGSWKQLDSVWMKRNRDRVAEVWMDEYKQYVYERTGPRTKDLGDIQSRLDLRKKNNCHDFEWYMDNVVPYMYKPKNALIRGVLRNPKSNKCIIPTSPVITYPCTKYHTINDTIIYSTLYWNMSRSGELRYDGSCLNFMIDEKKLTLYPCIENYKAHKWEYVELSEGKGGQMRCERGCLERSVKDESPFVRPCNSSNTNQNWVWGFE